MPERWNTQDVSLLDKPTRNNNKTQFQHWKTVNSSCMSSPYHICFYRKECHNLYRFTPFLHSKTKNNHLKIWHAWDESSCNQTTKRKIQKTNSQRVSLPDKVTFLCLANCNSRKPRNEAPEKAWGQVSQAKTTAHPASQSLICTQSWKPGLWTCPRRDVCQQYLGAFAVGW